MDVLYGDEGLRRLCENEREAKRRLGEPAARKLATRLADLDAAADLTELPAGNPHPLKGDRRGQFVITLHRGLRLVVEPAHSPAPTTTDGAINWGAVQTVTVVYIGDYHD